MIYTHEKGQSVSISYEDHIQIWLSAPYIALENSPCFGNKSTINNLHLKVDGLDSGTPRFQRNNVSGIAITDPALHPLWGSFPHNKASKFACPPKS
jgi:hypothetical protein